MRELLRPGTSLEGHKQPAESSESQNCSSLPQRRPQAAAPAPTALLIGGGRGVGGVFCTPSPSLLPPITRGSPQTNTCNHQSNRVWQVASPGLASPSVRREVPAAGAITGNNSPAAVKQKEPFLQGRELMISPFPPSRAGLWA